MEIRKCKRNFIIITGSGAYDSIRPLAYQDANVFLLCFNVGDPEDLKLAINKVRIFNSANYLLITIFFLRLFS